MRVLLLHFRNPKASSDTDTQLAVVLNKYDSENEKNYIFELENGSILKFTMEEDLSEEKSEPKDTSVERWMEKGFTFLVPMLRLSK